MCGGAHTRNPPTLTSRTKTYKPTNNTNTKSNQRQGDAKDKKHSIISNHIDKGICPIQYTATSCASAGKSNATDKASYCVKDGSKNIFHFYTPLGTNSHESTNDTDTKSDQGQSDDEQYQDIISSNHAEIGICPRDCGSNKGAYSSQNRTHDIFSFL